MRRPTAVQPLGELEFALMNVIWRHGPGTPREVGERLPPTKERAYTTVMTTLDRLHRKGLLLREKDGLAWRYRAAYEREEFERRLADALATRMLRSHGEAGLAALVDAAAEIDTQLLDRLEALIAARRKAQR